MGNNPGRAGLDKWVVGVMFGSSITLRYSTGGKRGRE